LPAGVLIVGLLVAASCSLKEGGYDETAWTLGARVETFESAPYADAVIELWIVDQDQKDGARAALSLGVQTTDAEGRASWEFSAVKEPYICGYEVRDAAGELLGTAAPDVRTHLGSGSHVTIRVVEP
jgi:hypothetical protein